MSQCGPSKMTSTKNYQNSKMIKMQEVMERPERRRREGRRLVRFAFARPSSLFCVPVLFLFLYLLWVYVFYGFYVGPAKLQRGATPPSVMVFYIYIYFIFSFCISSVNICKYSECKCLRVVHPTWPIKK